MWPRRISHQEVERGAAAGQTRALYGPTGVVALLEGDALIYRPAPGTPIRLTLDQVSRVWLDDDDNEHVDQPGMALLFFVGEGRTTQLSTADLFAPPVGDSAPGEIVFGFDSVALRADGDDMLIDVIPAPSFARRHPDLPEQLTERIPEGATRELQLKVFAYPDPPTASRLRPSGQRPAVRRSAATFRSAASPISYRSRATPPSDRSIDLFCELQVRRSANGARRRLARAGGWTESGGPTTSAGRIRGSPGCSSRRRRRRPDRSRSGCR